MKFKIANKWKFITAIIMAIIIISVLVVIGIIFRITKLKNDNSVETIQEEIIEENNEIEDNSIIIQENIEEENFVESEIVEEPNSNNTNINNSGSPYYIKVNNEQNVVTIYEKDENGKYTIPIKAMICSTGTSTPQSGKYKMPGGRGRWGTLFGHTPGTYVYGQYTTAIVGNILFHSVPYTTNGDPSSLEYWEYDRLGTKASAGCIRLTVRDAKWIYNNVPGGTIVEFYYDSNPGPLGKPASKKISDNVECRDWDPTDPLSDNPWKYYKEKEENNKKEESKEEIKNEIIKNEIVKNEINNIEESKNNAIESNKNNVINKNQTNNAISNEIKNQILTENKVQQKDETQTKVNNIAQSNEVKK